MQMVNSVKSFPAIQYIIAKVLMVTGNVSVKCCL